MRALYRLRVEIDSGKGALGRIGRAFESVGASIVAIDLQNVKADRAVDDVIVEFTGGVPGVEAVIDALDANDAGTMLAWSSVDEAFDPVLRSIRWACGIINAGVYAGDEVRRVIGEMCDTRDVWLFDIESQMHFDIVRRVAAVRTSVTAAVESLPDAWNGHFEGEVSVLGVPDARLSPRRVAVVARPIEQTFNATEIDRVEAILAVNRQVESLRPFIEDTVSPPDQLRLDALHG